MGSPALSGRAPFDIADIVRQHRDELERRVALTAAQRRVLTCIERCRTAALGGHVEVCCACGYEHPRYNSCCNRHCPKCQYAAQERWIRARTDRVLPTKHFHVVFTMPSELRALTKYKPKLVLSALFEAARDTLLELGESRLHATLGVTAVLHTWTRDLRLHPHVHALVTAGGLALDQSRWVPTSSKYLFPVKVMGKLLRGKLLDSLRHLHRAGKLEGFDDFRDPRGFDLLMQRLATKSWLVYAKRPFNHIDHVIKYLGRYTHRVGIANSRLVDVSDRAITFRTKNGATATLHPVEFLRRFVQHVLPDGFKKIRHAGLYAGANVDSKLARAAELCAAKAVQPAADDRQSDPSQSDSWQAALTQLAGCDVTRCPRCGGELVAQPLLVAEPNRRDTS
jgi:putative transposase/transposase-like zinc-binding protein